MKINMYKSYNKKILNNYRDFLCLRKVRIFFYNEKAFSVTFDSNSRLNFPLMGN